MLLLLQRIYIDCVGKKTSRENDTCQVHVTLSPSARNHLKPRRSVPHTSVFNGRNSLDDHLLAEYVPRAAGDRAFAHGFWQPSGGADQGRHRLKFPSVGGCLDGPT